MIETYKIVSGKYDKDITPTMILSDTRITRAIIYGFKSHVLNMINVNFILPTGWSITGIACQIGL